jgi:threonylcarbamoyladenosine tRNA methylthiotransferase MtaB
MLGAAAGFSSQNPGPQAQFVPLAHLDADQQGEAGSLSRGPAKILTGNIFESDPWLSAPVLSGESGHTRAVLKIQDGCNHRCSYCVIPFVRGRSRSLAPGQVFSEINKLSSAGFKEIVLSGINIGTYGRDLTPRIKFGDLLRDICERTKVERLRISSIEPMDVTRELIDCMASTDRIARHFHLPLQSGSDPILAAMHRWYRAEHYARRVELIRERIPDAAIGADVIAGFPGETEADHRATLDFISSSPLTYLHVFSFSKRPGTAAERILKEVPTSVIRERSRELRALGQTKNAAFRATQVGRVLRVLTVRHTTRHDTAGWTPAISSNYIRVRLRGELPANQMLDVLAVSASDAFVDAEILDALPAGETSCKAIN